MHIFSLFSSSFKHLTGLFLKSMFFQPTQICFDSTDRPRGGERVALCVCVRAASYDFRNDCSLNCPPEQGLSKQCSCYKAWHAMSYTEALCMARDLKAVPDLPDSSVIARQNTFPVVKCNMLLHVTAKLKSSLSVVCSSMYSMKIWFCDV